VKPVLGKLEQQLAQTQKKKDQLFQKLDPEKLEFFQPQIQTLQEEERRLEDQIREARAQSSGPAPKLVIEAAMEAYKNLLVALDGNGRPALRELLRALGVRIIYDPEKKEGRLRFDPFGQFASRKAQPPAAA